MSVVVFDDPGMAGCAQECLATTEAAGAAAGGVCATAAVAMDKVVAMGVADPNRLIAGGHSHGAFMTANLLAHSDLFRAGIARIALIIVTVAGLTGWRR